MGTSGSFYESFSVLSLDRVLTRSDVSFFSALSKILHKVLRLDLKVAQAGSV